MQIPRFTDLDLPPDVFAVVMATGIVSDAARDHGYRLMDRALAVIAVVTFVLLLAGVAIQVLARSGPTFGETGDPDVALRLFTFVAACSVLALRLDRHPALSTALDATAAAAWLVLLPRALRDVRARPWAELRDHAHGAWLLASVATSGLAIGAAHQATTSRRPEWVLVSLAAWLVAGLLYLAVTWLIVWWAVATPFGPDQVTPDSWILMGALAIATLAGATLLSAARSLGSMPWLVDAARPVTLLVWVLATLWIPVLLYAEVWRIQRRPGSLRFAGVWWSAVFPLGMYSSATYATAVQLGLGALTTVSLVLFWIALAAWLLVATGWVHSLPGPRRSRIADPH